MELMKIAYILQWKPLKKLHRMILIILRTVQMRLDWFQIAPRRAVKLDGPPSDPITFECSAPGAYQGGGPYDDKPLPAWTSAVHAAFIDSAAVECEEEGPIGYVES